MRGGLWLLAAVLSAACSGEHREAPAPRPGAQDSSPSRALSPDSSTDPWHIGPSATGVLNRWSSEAELKRHYGAQSVDWSRIELGEGETAPGAVLYPGDSLRRLEIIWRDTVERRQPARAVLRGRQSRWHVGRGISLGTSLQDLERLNGRPFTLAGFGWDYAGVVIGWEGGALDSTLGDVKLYLDPGPAQYESAPYSQVLGDREYSSALPAMQQLNPRVGQVFIDFE